MSRYTDVPDDSLFHDDIEWVSEVGISRPGGDEFHPDQMVPREEMAAFLHRTYQLAMAEHRGQQAAAALQGHPVSTTPPHTVIEAEPLQPPATPGQPDVATRPGTVVHDLPAGSHGDLTIEHNDGKTHIYHGHGRKAHYKHILLKGARNIVLRELTADFISNDQDDSSHIEIEGCAVKFIAIYGTHHAGEMPSDWMIRHNDIEGGQYCVGQFNRTTGAKNISIVGNKLLNPIEDAIRLNAFANVHVVDNEISGVIENGRHNDGLQTVHGGKGLTITGNWYHDNNCQTIFVKDGYVTDILIENNLSERNRAGVPKPVHGKLYASGGATIRRNTFWDSSPFGFRSKEFGGHAKNYVLDSNIMQDFYTDRDFPHVVTDRNNLFGRFRGDFDMDGSSEIGTWDGSSIVPGRGVDWKPEDRHFGLEAYARD